MTSKPKDKKDRKFTVKFFNNKLNTKTEVVEVTLQEVNEILRTAKRRYEVRNWDGELTHSKTYFG